MSDPDSVRFSNIKDESPHLESEDSVTHWSSILTVRIENVDLESLERTVKEGEGSRTKGQNKACLRRDQGAHSNSALIFHPISGVHVFISSLIPLSLYSVAGRTKSSEP